MTTHAESSDILTGGAWIVVRGVSRWVAEQSPADVAAEADEPNLAIVGPPSVAGLIACPTCHARVGQTCRTKTGHTTTPHFSRLVPRLCQCGALLASKSRYCPPCRDEVNRVNKRDYLRRRRAARRVAGLEVAS